MSKDCSSIPCACLDHHRCCLSTCCYARGPIVWASQAPSCQPFSADLAHPAASHQTHEICLSAPDELLNRRRAWPEGRLLDPDEPVQTLVAGA